MLQSNWTCSHYPQLESLPQMPQMPQFLDRNIQMDTPTLFNIRHLLRILPPSIWNEMFLYSESSDPRFPAADPFCYFTS